MEHDPQEALEETISILHSQGRTIRRGCLRTRRSCRPGRQPQRVPRDLQTGTFLWDLRARTVDPPTTRSCLLDLQTWSAPRTTIVRASPSGPFAVWLKSGGRTPDAMPFVAPRRCRRPARTSPKSDWRIYRAGELTSRSTERPLSLQAGAPLRAQETSSRAATSPWVDD